MVQERVPSGVEGLDPLIQGGFPRGSLVLLAGNPGTGKTVFASHFLHNGAVKFDENGLYVSFVEGRKTLIENMLSYGLDLERLEREGRIKILDLLTVKEAGVSAVLDMILSEIIRLKAKRLVIDSFTAMAQAFRERIEARIVLHTILGKMVRQAGCTTLLILEGEKIESEVEAYVVDGLLILRKSASPLVEERLVREIEISKMRGTKLQQPYYFFTLEGRFRVFPPFEPRTAKDGGKFKPVSDPEARFSTGSKDMDRLLGGGYPRGTLAFLEVDEKVSASVYSLILCPTLANFLAHRRGGMVIPPYGVSSETLLKVMAEKYGFTHEEIAPYLRIFEVAKPRMAEREPYVVPLKGEDIWEDYVEWARIEEELTARTEQPIVQLVAYDTLETVYGLGSFRRIVGPAVAKARSLRNLSIAVGCITEEAVKRAASRSDIYLRLVRDHGTYLLYGVKPRTSLHVLEMDTSSGYPQPKLTPIT